MNGIIDPIELAETAHMHTVEALDRVEFLVDILAQRRDDWRPWTVLAAAARVVAAWIVLGLADRALSGVAMELREDG